MKPRINRIVCLITVLLLQCGMLNATVQLTTEIPAGQTTPTVQIKINKKSICMSGSRKCLENDIWFGTKERPRDTFNFDKLFGFTGADTITWQEIDNSNNETYTCTATIAPALNKDKSGNAEFYFSKGCSLKISKPDHTVTVTSKRLDRPATATASAAGGKTFTIMTLNTYAWPEKINEATKLLLKNQLASGISKPIGQRVDEIGALIRQKNPDIVTFQELWGVNNKKRMIKALGCSNDFPLINPEFFECQQYAQYRYHFMDNTSNLDYAKTMSLVDSGLMISSKYKITWGTRISFPEKLDEEKYANKGALLALLEDPQLEKPVFIVNTHLQSGTSIEAIKVRQNQMRQIGQRLAAAIKNARPEVQQDYRIIIVGDLNDPIAYVDSFCGYTTTGSTVPSADCVSKRLVDRTGFMIEALRKEGINVSNAQVQSTIIKVLGATEIVDVNELKGEGIVYSTANGQKIKTLGKNDWQVQRLAGWAHEGGYFKFGSDNPGIQLLDHIFLDDKSKILDYQVMRKEVLSDPSNILAAGHPHHTKQKTYDPTTAISDHAAVMATIGN